MPTLLETTVSQIQPLDTRLAEQAQQRLDNRSRTDDLNFLVLCLEVRNGVLDRARTDEGQEVSERAWVTNPWHDQVQALGRPAAARG